MSSVSGPPQHPVTFEVSHGMIPVKGPLALMVERLKDWGFEMLAAFAELLASTFAFSDALFAATIVFGQQPGAQPEGPDCLQPYLGNLAAPMAVLMGAATCLAALLAAKKLAAIAGRLVSVYFTDYAGNFWQAKIKKSCFQVGFLAHLGQE